MEHPRRFRRCAQRFETMHDHQLQWAVLDDLELRVARRADELMREGVSPTELKLECWLRAEQEILDSRFLRGASAEAGRRPGEKRLSPWI
jgi:hypothetical protein